MKKGLNEGNVLQVLGWAYEQAIRGVPGTFGAIELANSYAGRDDSIRKAADSLVNQQILKCGTAGFMTGLGGIVTLPVAMPVNLAVVMYVQMRMIAAVAHIGGYDVTDDRVKSLVYLCMAGKKATDVAKSAGISFGQKLAASAMQRYLTGPVIMKINQAVGFRLVAQFGSKGMINVGRMVPIAGGFVCGGFDTITTKAIGGVAKRAFLSETVE